MATKIGIVYAAGSKLPRRIIVPDRDEELSDPAHVGPGEMMLLIGRNEKHDLHSVKQKIADFHKIDVADLPSGRCVLIDKNSRMVADAVMADPDIDAHPTHLVVAHERAGVNWKYEDGKFLARYAVVTPPEKPKAGDPIELEKSATVEDVVWLDPDIAVPPKDKLLIEDAHADIGDTVMAPVLVDVPSEGTVKL